MSSDVKCFWNFSQLLTFLGQLLEFFDIFLQHLPSFWNFCHFLELLVCFPFLKCFLETFATFQNFWFLLGKIKKWCNGLSAEGAKADVWSALHSPDDPPFFVFLYFLLSKFAVGQCVLWVLCGPSKATVRCYTSICDGIITMIRRSGGDATPPSVMVLSYS